MASTAHRPARSPGDYTDVAIETSYLLRLAFGLLWRQTEGLLHLLTALLGIAVGVPDHTTFLRRSPGLALATTLARAQASGPVYVVVDATGLKVHGTGEWLVAKHSERGTRTWRKLHPAIDPNPGESLASELTSNKQGDASQVGPLLDQIPGPIAPVTADSAYDAEPVYRAVAGRQPDPPVAVISRRAQPQCRARTPGSCPANAISTSRWSKPRDAWVGRRRSATASDRTRKSPCSDTRPSSAAASALGPCRPRRPRSRSLARCRTG